MVGGIEKLAMKGVDVGLYVMAQRCTHSLFVHIMEL
jgi:hypothetical protein